MGYAVSVRSRRPQGRGPAMGGVQIPASTRGLNLHDGIAAMKPADALVLDNWFPEQTYLRVRGGRLEYATGLGGTVESVMEWAGPSGHQAFGATATSIFDISSAGAVGAADVTGQGAGRYVTTMATTAGGAFLVACNGADDVLNYDGTTWTTPAITGVTSASLNFVALHKKRLWFIENNSTKAWYLPVSSIAGAASAIELGEQFTQGGKLIAMGSVSRDGGSGSDDYLAFVSSKGQVAVFQGDDPASANTWALTGVYNNAPPISNRCVANIAGDLAILTAAAVVSTRQLIASGQESAQRTSVSNRIDQGIVAAFASYGALTGWQVTSYPRYRMAVFNVPTSATTAFQFVVNTQTGAWCTYGFLASPLNATCWGMYNEQPYYGTSDGTVFLAESGYSDSGSGITAQVKSSFQPYGKSGGLARYSMIRPLFTAGGQPVPQLKINVDYRTDPPMSTDAFPLTPGAAGSIWDAALWDTGVWGSSDTPYNNWYAATGIGTVASVNMITVTNGYQCILNSWDLKMEVGMQVAL